jgi:cyclopropane-fatty-acyl-phospholipid synthase
MLLSHNAKDGDDFIFQFPSLDLLVRDGRFDQVHHQHVNYFSLYSFSKLLNKCGFKLVAYRFDPDHYGALMCHFQKDKQSLQTSKVHRFKSSNITQENILLSYQAFKLAMAATDIRLSMCAKEPRGGGIVCYGASLMLPILKYYMPAIANAKQILDSNKDKFGLSYVNFDVEIRDELTYDYVGSTIVVTAISTKLATRKIVNRLIDLGVENIILPYNTL